MPLVARTWEGLTFQDRVHRAAGRSLIAIAMMVTVETKRVTHVISGTLKRSVHPAPVNYDGSADEVFAKSHDLAASLPGQMDELLTHTLDGPVVEVGSWLPYACVEWVGRGHPGVTQGLESVRGQRVWSVVAKAFREEGL